MGHHHRKACPWAYPADRPPHPWTHEQLQRLEDWLNGYERVVEGVRPRSAHSWAWSFWHGYEAGSRIWPMPRMRRTRGRRRRTRSLDDVAYRNGWRIGQAAAACGIHLKDD